MQRKSSAFASWPYIVYSKEKKRPHAATAEPGEIIIVKEEELAPGGVPHAIKDQTDVLKLKRR